MLTRKSLVKKINIPKKVNKQKTPQMWGYSYSLETESVLPCLFFVWDNAAPKVMPDPKPIDIPMAKLSRAMP